jgi:hypothetical protein
MSLSLHQLCCALAAIQGGKGGSADPAGSSAAAAGAGTVAVGGDEAGAQESHTEEPSATSAMIEAIRKELARLKDLQGASDKAKQALTALDQKLAPTTEESAGRCLCCSRSVILCCADGVLVDLDAVPSGTTPTCKVLGQCNC